MENIEFIQSQDRGLINHETINDCFKLRHKVFNERLNWLVVSNEQREIDVYDNDRTWYAALKNESHQVIGTWRALPTTGDYMLRSVFPEMTRGEDMPENKKIWEISRFAIDKTMRTIPTDRTGICQESKMLIQSFYEFAHRHDIKQLVAVTSVAAERMMKKIDVDLRRLGDGKAVRIGNVLTTAILIQVPDVTSQLVPLNQQIKFSNTIERATTY